MSYFHYLKAYGIITLLILVMATSTVTAENSPVPAENTQLPYPGTTTVHLNMDYFTGYLTDTEDILTSPACWNPSDWLEASLITGIAVGLYTQDGKVKSWVQNHKNATTQRLADDASNIYTLSVPALAVFGAYGYISSDEKAKTTFLLSTESLVISGFFVESLKYTTGRARPYTGDSHNTWYGFMTNDEYHSFPSGDASSAFAIATVVAIEYDNMIVPLLVYGASTLIALERIHNNDHWSSDVFVGSVIGYFTSKAVVAAHSKQNNLSFVPFIDGKDRGVLVSYRF